MLQVTLAVDVNTGTIIIPAGLPGHESVSDWEKAGGHGIGACLAVSVPELQSYLRLHDHFMGSLHFLLIGPASDDLPRDDTEYGHYFSSRRVRLPRKTGCL